MAKDLIKCIPQLKYFHIFLIICLFSPIFLLNSQNVKNLRSDTSQKLDSPFYRHLEEVKLDSNSTKVCSLISDNLKGYYKTGDKTILGIDDDLKVEKGEHIQALINLVKIHFAKKENTKRVLFGEQILEKFDPDTIENLIVYGKHFLPLVIFFCIAILSFPGWIVCICCCCCCKCCCCCCCKKNSCKAPSFIFSYILYGIVALVCFYGLSKSNSIFTGISDTECSVLKFVDEVLLGETNKNPPYWAGIEGITDVLNKLSTKVETMRAGTETHSALSGQKHDLDVAKSTFETDLAAGSIKINDNYQTSISSNQYQLDIAYNFGKYTVGQDRGAPENSISDLWLQEYYTTAENAESYYSTTQNKFDNVILSSTDNSISQSLTRSKQSIKEIKESFDDIKIKVAGNIIKYGDDIDKNGKLIFKILYSVLIFMDAGVAAFMLLLCFCSGSICSCCSCARCFCKFFIHILWNIMAIFMIALFMFGSIFTISGQVGNDMISVVSYLVSKDNLGENSDTILLGDVKKYLNKCINSDGEILAELGFNMNKMESFDDIKDAELQLEDIKKEFKDKQQAFVHKEYLSQLDERVNFNTPELKLISLSDSVTPSEYVFNNLLKQINEDSISTTNKEKWNTTSASTETCSSSHPDDIIYHPKYCYPTDQSWVSTGLTEISSVLNEIRTMVNDADTKPEADNGIRAILTNLKGKYDTFLAEEIATIDVFIGKIRELTSIFNQYSGKEEKIFSFINCKFLKTNVQVILVNLKNVFGNDIYMTGVYLLMAACSLAIAIILTILLIVIINLNLVENKNDNNNNNKITEKAGDVPEILVYTEARDLKAAQN